MKKSSYKYISEKNSAVILNTFIKGKNCRYIVKQKIVKARIIKLNGKLVHSKKK